MISEKCPICGSIAEHYLIDTANLEFLRVCKENGNIDGAISLLRIVWISFPDLKRSFNSQRIIDGVSANLLKVLRTQVNETLKPATMLAEMFPELVHKLPTEIDKTIEDKMLRISGLLAKQFKETLNNIGFPEPEQMRLLSHLIPVAVPLLQQLLMLQKIPNEKGKAGELGLLDELKDCFPEDDYEHIGGSGDTDIIATPRYGDFKLNQRILIESKKNDSGWSSAFVENVRKHMRARANQFAILVVEVMPKGAKGFLIEHSNEGAVLVTSRKDVGVAYAALRSVFIATSPFRISAIDLRKLLEEKRIEEAVRDAMQYQEYLRKIRVRTARIMSNAKSIVESSEELDMHLKTCLEELRIRIKEAVEELSEAQTPMPAKDRLELHKSQ
jgi:uncharacterized protein YaiI (UPF0178 family)